MNNFGNFDVCLIDTSVIGHLIYSAYYGETDMEDYIDQVITSYNKAPFMPNVKNILWCGDSPPYWRKMLYSPYKSNRVPKEADLGKMLTMLYEKTNALKFPHYEADDVIATYCRLFKKQRILILTVDSDLLQLLEQDSKGVDRVSWLCAYGYEPKYRSLSTGGYEQWLTKKLSKTSAKKTGHLDRNAAQSLIDWKVLYRDRADCLKAGEEYRYLIDLQNPDSNWVLAENHPEFKSIVKRRLVKVKNTPASVTYRQHHEATGSYLPTQSIHHERRARRPKP